MKHTENNELTVGEIIATVLKTLVTVGPVLLIWTFYGKDILRWLVSAGSTIAWTVGAMAIAVAVAFAIVKLTDRLKRPKRYGILTADIIRETLRTK